jgi:D-sedoheptulose 7-phosphate isomerase
MAKNWRLLVGTIEKRFSELATLLPVFHSHAHKSIEESAIVIRNSFKNGNKILICGNGGSAADSQHFAAEFVNVFSRDIDRRGLPAMALSTDTSIITAIANDNSFENIFSRQVEAYANPGDVLVVMTTSGTSINCINALVTARTRKVTSIAFTRENAEIAKLADICIEVPSVNTQHIQECHMLAYHVITELVENSLFRGSEL